MSYIAIMVSLFSGTWGSNPCSLLLIYLSCCADVSLITREVYRSRPSIPQTTVFHRLVAYLPPTNTQSDMHGLNIFTTRFCHQLNFLKSMRECKQYWYNYSPIDRPNRSDFSMLKWYINGDFTQFHLFRGQCTFYDTPFRCCWDSLVSVVQ